MNNQSSKLQQQNEQLLAIAIQTKRFFWVMKLERQGY